VSEHYSLLERVAPQIAERTEMKRQGERKNFSVREVETRTEVKKLKTIEIG
jgi:hypothetical protein